jgi:flagellar hook-associated protein 2
MAIELLNALGAGSGLDSKAIVDALVAAERAPQESRITKKITESEASISAYGQVTSVLEGVRSAFEALNDVNDLSEVSVSNSSSAFSVSAGAGAQPGQYDLTVSQLAAGEERASSGFADASASVNSGNALTLTVVTGVSSPTTTTVTPTSDTPEAMVAALNNAGLGLSARIVDTGVGATPKRIVVTGAAGAEQAFTITASAGSLDFTTQNRAASDAAFTLNNLSFSRASNEVQDVLPGVTLSLESVAANQRFSLERTTAGTEAALRNLVDAYNVAETTLNELTDPDSAEGGVLLGDSIISYARRTLSTMVGRESSSPTGGKSRLLDFGIERNRQGLLEIDEVVFSQRVRSDFADLSALLTAGTNNQSLLSADPAGLAGDALKDLDALLATRGPLRGAVARMEGQIEDQELALLALEDRMDRIYDRYLAQFTAMEQLVEEMNTLSDSLTSTFDTLPFSPKKD